MSLKLIFLVGPTASGKSGIALKLAQQLNAAIINCDSIQVYKELSIGAAKPSSEDLKMAPHFLYDMISFPQEYTAGDYYRDFYSLLEKIGSQFPIAIVVGGTGFYFQAIENGMFEAGKVAPEVMQKIYDELMQEGGAARLYRELISVDPGAAQVIHENDHYRLQRAIGIWRSYGKTISELRSTKRSFNFPYPLKKYGVEVEKKILEDRIRARVFEMLDLGLITEVESLLAKGYRDWVPLKSVGYREVIEFLDKSQSAMGNLSSHYKKEELVQQIVISTRQLAKKQRTWFQRDKDILWLNPESAIDQILRDMSYP